MQPPQPPQYPVTPRESSNLRDYGLIVLKNAPIIVLLAAAGFLVSWWVTRRQPRLYRARATIEMVQPRHGGMRSMDIGLTPAILLDETYLNTQLQKLQMTETLRAAVARDDLASRPQFRSLTESEIVRMHAGNISASQRRGQYLVDVSVSGPNAEILDDVTNSLVRQFQEEQRDETERLISARRSTLEEAVANANARARMLEVEKRQELEAGGFTDLTFETDYMKLSEEQRQYVEEQTKLRLRLIQNEATYNTFVAALAEDPDSAESLSQHPRVIGNTEIQGLLQGVERLRVERDEARIARGLAEGNSELQTFDRAIGREETKRRERQLAIVRHFVLDYEGDRAALARLDAEVESRVAKLRDATRVKAKVDELSAAIDRQLDDKKAAQRELEFLAQNSLMAGETVKILGSAAQPDPNRPDSPNKPLNYTLGSILGLLAGIGFAFVRDYLDDTIRTKDELRKITDIDLLGVIPQISGRAGDAQKKDLYAFHQPKSTVAEAYRGARTALTMRSHGTRHRVLALTSAGPKEGKTTTVINLATVLAYSSKRTLIIDADLRKPRIHKSFGLDNSRGLTNLIVSAGDPEEFTKSTDVPGVDVLVSGPIPPNPSELLGSERMREVVATLRRKYDHVIIDTPPIGAVTDAAVLGTIVDGVILVVHAGKTRGGIVQRGIEQLRYINAPIEGVILNNLRIRGRYYPGYYNYYYYYSYYGSGKSRKARPDAAKAAATAGAAATDSGDGSPLPPPPSS